MAYQSDESGRFEVYVRPYPQVDTGRWQISTDGGTSPRWSPDGRELFYLSPAGLMRVGASPGSTFSASQPRRLFAVKPFGGRLGGDYEVSPDGRRFLFILDGPPAALRPVQLVVVQNWVAELSARLAAAQ
jgi:serine/threonine-protein kinase